MSRRRQGQERSNGLVTKVTILCVYHIGISSEMLSTCVFQNNNSTWYLAYMCVRDEYNNVVLNRMGTSSLLPGVYFDNTPCRYFVVSPLTTWESPDSSYDPSRTATGVFGDNALRISIVGSFFWCSKNRLRVTHIPGYGTWLAAATMSGDGQSRKNAHRSKVSGRVSILKR